MINRKSKFLSTKKSFSLKVFLVIDRAFSSPQQMWSEPALPKVEVWGTILMAIKLLLAELFKSFFTVEGLVLETIVSIRDIVGGRGCTSGGCGELKLVADSHARGVVWTE